MSSLIKIIAEFPLGVNQERTTSLAAAVSLILTDGRRSIKIIHLK
jgi:hypothetical protein